MIARRSGRVVILAGLVLLFLLLLWGVISVAPAPDVQSPPGSDALRVATARAHVSPSPPQKQLQRQQQQQLEERTANDPTLGDAEAGAAELWARVLHAQAVGGDSGDATKEAQVPRAVAADDDDAYLLAIHVFAEAGLGDGSRDGGGAESDGAAEPDGGSQDDDSDTDAARDPARWTALALALTGPHAARVRARRRLTLELTVHLHAPNGPSCVRATRAVTDALAAAWQYHDDGDDPGSDHDGGSGSGRALEDEAEGTDDANTAYAGRLSQRPRRRGWAVTCTATTTTIADGRAAAAAAATAAVGAPDPAGLVRRSAVLSLPVPATTPRAPGAYLLLLEDVADISPLLLPWVDHAIGAYLRAPPPGVRLMGASLYAPAYNEVNDTAFAAPTATPYLLQFPPAWGSVYPARAWTQFRAFVQRRIDATGNVTAARATTANNQGHNAAAMAAAAAVQRGGAPLLPAMDLPHAYSNRWPSATSWRKWLARYLGKTGGLVLYPPADASLVRPHASARVVGHPPNSNEPDDRAVFFPALAAAPPIMRFDRGDGLGAQRGASASLLPWEPAQPLSALPVLDLYHRSAPSANAVARRLPVQAWDGCTVILTVYSRLATLKDRLDHLAYAGPAVRAVLVIWNNVDVPPLVLPPHAYPIPVIIKPQTRNSMNNRFAPQPEIATDCVMTMDDDADIAYPVLELVSRVWHSHHFDRAVGVFGRRHYRSNAADDCGQYVYEMAPNNDAPSMVLPTAMAFHRSLLAAYQALPAWLLRTVDDVINCDDLLMNMLVANVSGRAPILLGTQARTITDLSERGLFSRPQHRSTRSWCLNAFTSAFPGAQLPLHCSRVYPAPPLGFSVAEAAQYVPPARDEIPSFACDLTDRRRKPGEPDCRPELAEPMDVRDHGR
jgi:hypothetical protein